ncbi:MAG TPA: DUF6531 domain-containing protein, partial [Thermoanaerobaculia bacterium]
MTEPRELKLVPIDCYGNEFPSETWGPVTIAPTATEPKVSLTVDKGFDPQANRVRRKGIVTWDLGLASSNWVVRVHLLPWTTADGNTYSGAEVWRPTTTARTGKGEFFFDTPGGAQQIVLRALAESCVGRDTKDVPVDCGCEENASSADPVYFKDGNVRVYDSDPLPPIAGQVLARTYNSDEQVVALFGRGWTTLFERRLILNMDGGEQVVSLVTGTNEVVTFRGSGNTFRQTWPTARPSDGILEYDAGTGTYSHRAAGSTETAVFRESDGRLLVLRDTTSGREARIGYDAQGLPQSLSDSWSGTSWVLTIDAPSRRVSSIGVGGRPDLTWSYSYDGAGNLRNVTAPGSAAWRTYEYNANRMTASYGPSGNLIESHTYDANGYGISSTGPGDEIGSIEYNLPGSVADERVTRVTYKTGATAEYALRPAGGAYRPVRVTGGCSSCGASDATYVHDQDGRVIREQSPDGYITVKTYNGAALASEERFLRPTDCDPATDAQHCRMSPDALATASLQATSATVLSTYTYGDPLWPDRVTAVATPSVFAPGRTRRESHSYHPRSGALAGTSVLGWSGEEPSTDFERTTSRKFYGDATACNPRGDDGCPGTGSDDGLTPLFAPGGAFDSAWLSLPQPARLVKSIDGPRTDVQDVTSFVYYPIHSSVPALWRGQLAATKNAAGHVTRYESYDIFGNATRVVDPNGVVSEVTFDTLSRPVTSTLKGVAGCSSEPLCGTDLVTTRSYATAGPLITEVRPGGAVTSYTYDGRGRVRTLSRGLSVTDLREQVEYSYDPLNGKKSGERMLARENGVWVEKRQESFAYDSDARLQIVTHADASTVHYTYDAADRVRGIRDENHSAANTTYAYDPAGRVRSVTQTLTGAVGGVVVTRYGYDLHGNLTSVTDPNGNVTSYLYDDYGSLVRQTSPVTGTTTYSYDQAGNLQSTTDARGVTTSRVYDVLGRVTLARAGAGEGESDEGGGVEEVRWTYDTSTFGVGRLAQMTDPTGSTSYAYERRGLLASEAKTIEGTTYTTGYGYDANGNRSRIDYPSGRGVSYTYDFADRPFSASAGQTPLVTSARYLPFGPLTEIVYGNGTTKRMTYDARYRAMTNSLAGGEDFIASYSYGHDPVGNITAIHDTLDPSFNRDFGYDDLNRLTVANTGAALWGAASNSYDAMGNIRTMTLGRTVGRTFTYHGTTPKLASSVENGETRNVLYDAAGNELLAAGASYEYTPRNHLARQNTTSYSYDGRGVRTITLRPAGILELRVPSTVSGGSTAQGEVVLSSPAPAAGAVVTLASSNPVASVPPSVTVGAGETAAAFTISTSVVTGEQRAILTATFNGSQRTATVSVVGSRFDDVSVAPQSVVGGDSARGTITLSSAPADRDASISMRSSSDAVRVPEMVVVRAGERSADFSVSTVPVIRRTVARISATVGGEERETALTILPPSLLSITFTPASLTGSSSTTGMVTFNGRAPEGGLSVALSTLRDLLSVPPVVSVAAGERTATFTATAVPVEAEAAVAVTASAGESSITANVTILPPDLTHLSVAPATIIGGDTATATVTINAPAAAEEARVQLSTSDSAIAASPAHVFVPSGTTEGTARITTAPVPAPTPIVVSASRAGITRSATVTIEPPPATIASFAVATSSVVGTNDVLATVTLTSPAPATGVEIELASSDAAAAVPPVITIASGATAGTFRIKTALVAAPANVILTATHATTVKTAALAVMPPAGNYIASLGVVPTFIVGGTTATATVTLAFPSGDHGGSDVHLTSSAPLVLSVPSVVKVNGNSTTATFTVTTAAVPEPVAATLTATY